jgi:CRP-like cAMP-binding protein
MIPLRSFDLFSRFSSGELSKLEFLCQTRSLSAGEFLFREGDTANAFYVIASGEIEILRSRDGQTRRISLLGEADTVGEMAFFDPAGAKCSRNADARATVPTELVVILADALDTLGSSEPDLVKTLEKIIRERKARE